MCVSGEGSEEGEAVWEEVRGGGHKCVCVWEAGLACTQSLLLLSVVQQRCFCLGCQSQHTRNTSVLQLPGSNQHVATANKYHQIQQLFSPAVAAHCVDLLLLVRRGRC